MVVVGVCMYLGDMWFKLDLTAHPGQFRGRGGTKAFGIRVKAVRFKPGLTSSGNDNGNDSGNDSGALNSIAAVSRLWRFPC